MRVMTADPSYCRRSQARGAQWIPTKPRECDRVTVVLRAVSSPER